MSADKAQNQIDPRLQKLLTLATLLKNARHRKKRPELSFMMVNQTFNLVNYRHCIFWKHQDGKATLDAASGLVQLDPDAPYSIWMRKVVEFLVKTHAPEMTGLEKEKGEDPFARSFPLTPQTYTGPEADQWRKWSSANALFMPMKDLAGHIRYGLWIDRDEPFTEQDRALLEDICDGYAHVLHRLPCKVFSAPAQDNRTGVSGSTDFCHADTRTVKRHRARRSCGAIAHHDHHSFRRHG
jgi:hypothetical protein